MKNKFLLTFIMALCFAGVSIAGDFVETFDYASQSEFEMTYWDDFTNSSAGTSLIYDVTGGGLRGLELTSSNANAYCYVGFEKNFDTPVTGDFILEMDMSWGDLTGGIAGLKAIFTTLSEIPTPADQKAFGLGIWGRGIEESKYTISYSLDPTVMPVFAGDMTRSDAIGPSNSSGTLKLIRVADEGSLYWNDELIVTATMTTSAIDVMYIGFTGYCPAYTTGEYGLNDMTFDEITIVEQEIVPGTIDAVVGETNLAEGETTSYSLGLSRAPNSPVDILIETDDNVMIDVGEGYVNSATLNFTGTSYDPVTVNVWAVENDGLEGYDQLSVINHTVDTEDTGYLNAGFTDENLNYQGVSGALAFYVNDTECGAWGFYAADLNQDCDVSMADFAIMASNWLNSTVPFADGAEDLLIICENQNTGQGYHSIQRALDSSSSGDTIVVYEGQYDGPIIIPAHDLTLTHAAGLSAADVVINGPLDNAAILLTHGGTTPQYTCTISGLMITGGYQAILGGSTATAILNGCVIEGITQPGTTAPDIELIEDFVGEINDCYIANNTMVKAGVLRADPGGTVTVRRTLFENNNTGATSRGLIASSLAYVENSIFTGNTCSAMFYYCYEGSSFVNNTMYDNDCYYAVLAGNQTVDFYNNIDFANADRTPIVGSGTFDIATGSNVENNIFDNTLDASLSATNIYHAAADTLFADPANGILTPASGSPAIDAGDAAAAPADDFTGNSRDDNPDIGAVEF
ncbi:hypothetical protein SMSP2_00906 [Limihaloglobus sulfuriphilus]|uniref:Right handed beta helix domain-containing protein n=1 Tax=Limihaloglobus sulfuriphilus TaxID=1851148 RepID=A0A1Q2MD25_9BACT|nr:right-handed parallel beta-helix repeat-containing protein [Limihaloglobus sulfuriphilus]AQQ70554.1 hypothetical protein SMSP2_00906 [Limihaloglobus sulfuriphilus]